MVKVKSNIDTVARQWTKQLREEVELRVRRAAVKTALVGETRVKSIMEKEAYDTGALLRSVHSSVTKHQKQIILQISSQLDYAYYIEHGRKPGKFPNLDALVKWVGRKLRREGINTRVNVSFDQLKDMARTGGGKVTKQQQAYRAHLNAVYLIGRAISKKGIRGKLIFKRIEDGLLRYFQNEVQQELNALQ